MRDIKTSKLVLEKEKQQLEMARLGRLETELQQEYLGMTAQDSEDEEITF